MIDGSNLEEPLYDPKHQLETATLKSNLKKIKIKGVKELGQKFCNNLDLVGALIMLPHTLLAFEHMKRSLVPHELYAAVKARVEMRRNRVPDEQWHEYFEQSRKEIFETDVLPRYKNMLDEAMSNSGKTFQGMLKDEKLKSILPYEALLYSAVVWIWCSYELLMKELWEFTINKSGKLVSKHLLKNLQNSGGLNYFFRGKYISLDYLAKYDYNLSNKLGSTLMHKFDFTSPNGIKEAYSSAFPRSMTIKKALNNRCIIELEATRNVIVHNAGIIDEEYCNKTNTDKSEVNKKLVINNHKVCEFGSNSIDTGLRVMTAVSSILSRTI